MMEFTEKLIESCAIAVNGTTKATFGEHEIDFKAPYKRVTMAQSILDNPELTERFELMAGATLPHALCGFNR